MVTERGFSSPGSDPGFSPNDPYEDFADAHDSGIDPNDHYQDFADADGDPGFDPNDYQDFANADDDPNFDPNDPYQVFEAADGGPAFAPPEGYRWYEATDVDEGFWGPGVYAEPATAQFESEFYRTTAYPAYAATRGGPGPGSADGLPRPTAADEERDFALAAQLQIMDLQNELSRPRPRRQTSRGSPHGIGFHEWNFPAPPRPGPFEEAAMDAARVDAARERRNREVQRAEERMLRHDRSIALTMSGRQAPLDPYPVPGQAREDYALGRDARADGSSGGPVRHPFPPEANVRGRPASPAFFPGPSYCGGPIPPAFARGEPFPPALARGVPATPAFAPGGPVPPAYIRRGPNSPVYVRGAPVPASYLPAGPVPPAYIRGGPNSPIFVRGEPVSAAYFGEEPPMPPLLLRQNHRRVPGPPPPFVGQDVFGAPVPPDYFLTPNSRGGAFDPVDILREDRPRLPLRRGDVPNRQAQARQGRDGQPRATWGPAPPRFNRHGYDDQGYNRQGFDRRGVDREGYDLYEAEAVDPQVLLITRDRHVEFDGTDAQAVAGPAEGRECTSCGDEYARSELNSCPCSHEYCHVCLSQMFKLAVEEESLFPARCCNEAIPVDDHLDILSPELVERYRARDEEHRSTNRVYCHVPTCSTFCSGKAIREHIATCPKCGRKTCVKCKAAQHESKECPENESDKKVEVLGKREGWQHCIKCNHLVEKEYGCDHMTCACGAEFCYRCGTAWPCDCDSVPEIVPRPAVMLGTLPVGGGGPNRPETLPLGENGASMPHEHEQDHHWLRGDAPAACWLCWAQVHLIYQCDTCFMMICDACWQGRQGGF